MLCQDSPEGFSADSVKSLGKVYEDGIQVHNVLNAFFWNMAHSKDHINDTAARTESTLRLCQGFFRDAADQTTQNKTSQIFTAVESDTSTPR